MKQKKFGQKVKNWHRPLPPSALKARYLRERDQVFDDAELKNMRFSVSTLADDYWNQWNPHYDPYDDWYDEPYCDEDFQPYRLRNTLTQFFEPANPLTDGQQAKALLPEDRPFIEKDRLEYRRSPGYSLEFHLADHLLKVRSEGAEFAEFLRDTREAIGDIRNLAVLKAEAARHQSDQLAQVLCLFAPFWVRCPLSWQPNSGQSLIEHVFKLHEPPNFLHPEWQHNEYEYETKWLSWFLLLSQGGSLKRAAELFGWQINGKFQHFLYQVPAAAYPLEACMRAEILRMGGDEIDFERLSRHSAFVLDPTEPSATPEFLDFWQETASWLIARHEEIADAPVETMLDWAFHEFTEGQRHNHQASERAVFSWRGRTLRSVMERSEAYQQSLFRRNNPYISYHWLAYGWNWTWEQAPDCSWSFVELTTGQELAQESQRLHHCVASYGGRCVADQSAIVSLRLNEKPVITIEINPASRVIVQARGTHNREAQASERLAITRLHQTVVCPPQPKPDSKSIEP